MYGCFGSPSIHIAKYRTVVYIYIVRGAFPDNVLVEWRRGESPES
jgi:hypothetical protein